MKLSLIIGILAGVVVGIALMLVAISLYFFRRTMVRSNAKRERTQKMAGTDWDAYIPGIRAAREWLVEKEHEEVSVTARDGLKLFGNFFPQKESKNVVICFHGYTSEGLNDYTTVAKFYYEEGYNLLIVDERAHGKSEGTYIGFGCLDRHDAKVWIDYVIERVGEDCNIVLHGDSMGGATVLMTTGLALPAQVKAAVSDCAFTSAWEVFSSVLKNMYHMYPTPIMQISNGLVKRKAGYELDECNAKREVAKTKIPILFIHGSADSFVPCSMVHKLYEACASKKELLIVEGAGHVESCYKEAEKYTNAIRSFIFPIVDGGMEE